MTYLQSIHDIGESTSAVVLTSTRLYDFCDLSQREKWLEIVVALIEYLRSSSRQIIFSAAISPSAAASALAALQVLQDEPQHRQRLWANYHYLRGIMERLGLDYWQSPTPALPIVVGDKEKCYWLWKTLWEEGLFYELDGVLFWRLFVFFHNFHGSWSRSRRVSSVVFARQ